jgi:EAL domain-containing protein (putative c-di-GMP-specific phosphodiesterase class I)
MIEPGRFLGFAFLNADLLFEVDSEGKILFATGATNTLTKRSQNDLVGYTAGRLFRPADGAKFMTYIKALRPGQRLGPATLALAGGDISTMSLFHVPTNKHRISCSLTLSGAQRLNFPGSIDVQTSLPDSQAFLSTADATKSDCGQLALVNLPNLPDIAARLRPDEAKALYAHIGQTVKAMHAAAAGRLSETCFAIVADDPESAKKLAANIQDTAASSGAGDLVVESKSISLESANLTPEQTLLAMRHVVERLARTEFAQASQASIAETFNTLVTETLDRAMAFSKSIAEDTFRIVFEPVVDLKNGKTSHYEVLTRFPGNELPAEMILLAETLGIVDALDLAVTAKVFAAIDAEPKSAFALAINVSGRTLATPSSFALLLGILQNKQSFAKRVLIEITESAEIRDLGAANAAIQSIRQLGYRVGIDDFGAGSASLQYLHNFDIDFVKFDRLLVERLGESNRQDLLFRGLIDTCSKLGIETTAEWVEDYVVFKRAKEIGCRFGQGRYFGDVLQSLASGAIDENITASASKQPRKSR